MLKGQNVLTFDSNGWNADQSLSSSLSLSGFSFISNKTFFTNYGYNFNTDNVSIYFVFENPSSDNITITTPNNELLNLNSISAYQVSEKSTNPLIIEGWDGSNLKYTKSFSNIYNWQALSLNYQSINKLVIKSGSGYSGLTDYNFDNLTYDKSIPNVVRAKIKVFLQGPYANSMMKTNLNDAGILPLAQPYNTTPWNYTGTEKATGFPSTTVDWILVELKALPNSTALIRRAALLQSDGRVFDVDGIEGVKFDDLVPGNYYIVIRHRNHLAIMSSLPVPFNVASPQYDFTASRDLIYGTGGIVYLGNNIYGMYSGDADANGIVNETDYEAVGQYLFQAGYVQGDVDLTPAVNVLDYKQVYRSLSKTSQVP